MVVFGGIIISNEIFVLMLFGPMIFAVWYIRNAMNTRPIKCLYDDSGGDGTLYPAVWDLNAKSVTIKRSRDKKQWITIKKVASPKRIFVPPYSTQFIFRGKEGTNKTLPWEDDDKTESEFDQGYAAASMQHHWLSGLKGLVGISIKNPIVYMSMMAGAGLSAMIIFLAMLLTGNI